MLVLASSYFIIHAAFKIHSMIEGLANDQETARIWVNNIDKKNCH